MPGAGVGVKGLVGVERVKTCVRMGVRIVWVWGVWVGMGWLTLQAGAGVGPTRLVARGNFWLRGLKGW